MYLEQMYKKVENKILKKANGKNVERVFRVAGGGGGMERGRLSLVQHCVC